MLMLVVMEMELMFSLLMIPILLLYVIILGMS